MRMKVICNTISGCTAEVILRSHFIENSLRGGFHVFKCEVTCSNTTLGIRSMQDQVLSRVVVRKGFTAVSDFGHAR